MIDETLRRLGILLVVAALCAASAGCAVDIGSTKADGSTSTNQLHYSGGPKSPMWSGQ